MRPDCPVAPYQHKLTSDVPLRSVRLHPRRQQTLLVNDAKIKSAGGLACHPPPAPPPIHRQSTANPPSQGPIYRPIARGLARTTAAPLKYLRIKKESSSLAGLIMDSQEFNLRRRAALKRPNGQRVTFIASLRNAHLAWMEWDDRRGSIISWKGRQKGRAFR
jgi:hypothetical protein